MRYLYSFELLTILVRILGRVIQARSDIMLLLLCVCRCSGVMSREGSVYTYRMSSAQFVGILLYIYVRKPGRDFILFYCFGPRDRLYARGRHETREGPPPKKKGMKQDSLW